MWNLHIYKGILCFDALPNFIDSKFTQRLYFTIPQCLCPTTIVQSFSHHRSSLLVNSIHVSFTLTQHTYGRHGRHYAGHLISWLRYKCCFLNVHPLSLFFPSLPTMMYHSARTHACFAPFPPSSFAVYILSLSSVKDKTTEHKRTLVVIAMKSYYLDAPCVIWSFSVHIHSYCLDISL